MNLYFTAQYDNVKEFEAISGNLFFINQREELFKNENKIGNNIFGISKSKLFLFAYRLDVENRVETILVDIEKLKIEVKFPLLSDAFDGITTLFGYDYNSRDKTRQYKVYNLKLQKIEFELNNRYSIGQCVREKDIIFYRDIRSNIFCLNIYLDTHLWQYSVSEIGKYNDTDGVGNQVLGEGKVEKIIGVFAEVLVVVITGGGERLRGSTQLIGLHTQTGELLWQLDTFEHQGIYYKGLPTTATLQADAQNKNLVGFQSGYFIEIDPQIGKVLRCSSINRTFGSYTLTGLIDSFSLVGEHLYFRSSVSSMGGFPTAIGAFNYQTETIEWLHVFEEFAKEGKFIPINQPKAEGNRVYALDSGNTLHIFEREEK